MSYFNRFHAHPAMQPVKNQPQLSPEHPPPAAVLSVMAAQYVRQFVLCARSGAVFTSMKPSSASMKRLCDLCTMACHSLEELLRLKAPNKRYGGAGLHETAVVCHDALAIQKNGGRHDAGLERSTGGLSVGGVANGRCRGK